MNGLYTLLVLGCLSATAQIRNIGVSVHPISPNPMGDEVYENSVFHFQFGVVNQVPDTMFPNDFMMSQYFCDISQSFDVDSIHIVVINEEVLPGDTVVLEDSIWLPSRDPSNMRTTASLVIAPVLLGGEAEGNTTIAAEEVQFHFGSIATNDDVVRFIRSLHRW